MVADRLPSPSLLPRGLSSGAQRHVESELVNYHRTKAEIARRARDIAESGGYDLEDEGPRAKRGHIGDPTGFRACLLAQDRLLTEMRRFVDAIDDVLATVTPEHRHFIEVYYWKHASIQQASAELGVSQETAYRLRKGVLLAIAARLGWS